MLILGDGATAKYNKDHDIYTKEFLCHNKHEIKFLKEKLGLSESKVERRKTERYVEYKKDGYRIIIVDAEISVTLQYVLKKAGSIPYKMVIADPLINFCWVAFKAQFQNRHLENWLKLVNSYNFLYENYIDDLLQVDKSKERLITLIVKNLKSSLAFLAVDLKFVSYPFDVIDQSSLYRYLDIVSKTKVSYNPYYITTNQLKSRNIDKEKFERLKYDDKITCVTDMLYIDTLQECIMPDMLTANSIDTSSFFEVKYEFCRCLMHRISRKNQEYWLSMFLLHHNKDIKNNFEDTFVLCYKNNLKKNQKELF